MNTFSQIERFNQDVDKLLNRELLTESESWPETYRQDIEIVRAFVVADFSAESLIRSSLKRDLLGKHFDKSEQKTISLIFQKAFFRLAIAGLLTAVLILAASPLGATLAQTAIQIVQSWQLGENTLAVSVGSDFIAVPDENGNKTILPAENPVTDPEFIDPALETETESTRHITLDPTTPFDRAQEMVTFTIQQPTFVPEGYEFQGVVVNDPGQVSLEYLNASEVRLIGLLQTAVGDDNREVQVTFTSDIVAIDVEVGGQKALWTQAEDEGMLIWEAEGINYQLMGSSDLDLALQIAESLE